MDWKQIEKELRKDQVPGKAQDAESFWKTFKEKADKLPQDAGNDAKPPQLLPMPVWALAALFICLLVSVSWFVNHDSSGSVKPDGPDGPVITSTSAPKSQVKSIEVLASWKSAVIMEDNPEIGTILWISGDENDTTLNKDFLE